MLNTSFAWTNKCTTPFLAVAQLKLQHKR